jgi:hypothetical protein
MRITISGSQSGEVPLSRLEELATSVQPFPVESPDSKPVLDRALEVLRAKPAATDVIAMLELRKEFGLKKYDTVLQSHNGRDPVCDGAQELLDAIVYITQAKMEGHETTELIPLVNTIMRLVSME